MLDLSIALNCLRILEERREGNQYRVGIINTELPHHRKGQVVLFRNEMTPTLGELQMGEYRGMKQRPTKRVTVESPLTPEAIAKNKTRGSGIVTIGTTIGVPRGYVDEIKL